MSLTKFDDSSFRLVLDLILSFETNAREIFGPKIISLQLIFFCNPMMLSTASKPPQTILMSADFDNFSCVLISFFFEYITNVDSNNLLIIFYISIFFRGYI